MMESQITISVSKFKEILLHSWELLPEKSKQELVALGIYPTSRPHRD